MFKTELKINDLVVSNDPIDRGFKLRILHISATGVCQCRVLYDDSSIAGNADDYGDIVWRHIDNLYAS